MGLTPADIGALLEQFEASSWQEMTIDIGEDHLHVSRRANGSTAAPAAVAPSTSATPAPSPVAVNGEAAVPTVSPPPPTAPAAVAAGTAATGVAVEAPSVGLFWRSPAPGAPPFVEVGSPVEPGDTLAIIEVMKLMSPLKAGLSGVVTAILVDNGATVTRGEPLVLIDPAR